MKILRKNDEFKKMPDKTIGDVLKINSFVRQGWDYCSRQAYKDFFKVESKKEIEKPEIKEKKEKKKIVR